jgi:hypothetical protein
MPIPAMLLAHSAARLDPRSITLNKFVKKPAAGGILNPPDRKDPI